MWKLSVLIAVLAAISKSSAQEFHNQLSANAAPSDLLRHAVQMGYDFVMTPAAHSYGLKTIQRLDATASFLSIRDRSLMNSVNPLTTAQMAEYDQYLCMRDPTSTDITLRYYLAWVDPDGGTGTDFANYPQVWVIPFVNYRSAAAMNGSLNWLSNNLDWSNIDGGFVDQADVGKFSYASNNNTHVFGTFAPAGSLTDCVNPGTKDYSVSQGFLVYRQGLRDVFHNHGQKAAANPWNISAAGQELQADTPFDHYMNESGQNNDASTWGIVPAGIGQVEMIYPGYSDFGDFGMALAAAGTGGKQGSWFGGYGEDWHWIVDWNGNSVPGMNAIQLLHAMPNWDNLVGAGNRSWSGSAYSSDNSYADNNIVYSRHAKTKKLFVVFRSAGAAAHIRGGETVAGVQCADSLFIESGDCTPQLSISGTNVQLSGSGVLNQGYVVTLSGSALPPPPPPPPSTMAPSSPLALMVQ